MLNLLVQTNNCGWSISDTLSVISIIVGFGGSILGAFLGFRFAMYLSIKTDKNNFIRLIENVKNELTLEYDNQSKIKAKVLDYKNVDEVALISLPFLDKFILSNNITIVKFLETDKKKYNINFKKLAMNCDLYEKLISIQKQVLKINHWYSLKNDFWLNNSEKIDLENLDENKTLNSDETNQYIGMCNGVLTFVESLYSKINRVINDLK